MRRFTPRTLAGLVLGAAVLLSLTAVRLQSTSTATQTDYISVGQGDSILLRDGNGFDVLVDGGRSSAGPTVLAHLRAQGITELDVMVATHADADHIGGLIDVLAAGDITVQQVLYNGYPGTTATWANFATAVANEGTTPVPAQFPSEYVWGGMTVQVLNPQPGLIDPDQNNASVVLHVHHSNVDYLLTGDIDSTAEAAIVARGTPIAAEVLKVAHHGSAYSSGADFLAAVGATEAIITVGANSYGHPTDETLSRLAAAGASVWRTDQSGTVTVISTGDAYTVTVTDVTYLVFLPVMLRQATPTPTNTATATHTQPLPTNAPTATPTHTVPPATATFTQPPSPSSLSIVTLSGSSNPEYVTITNSGGSAQDMTGWRLYSAVGSQTYFFPNGYVLGVGASVQVQSYTAATSNPPSILFWTTAAIWNNTGDRAELYNSGNQLVSSVCYAAGC
jgi:competence protein ComEC